MEQEKQVPLSHLIANLIKYVYKARVGKEKDLESIKKDY